MYIITDKITSENLDVSGAIVYVKQQNNGRMVRCPEEQATFVYLADSDRFYGLWGYDLTQVDVVPEGLVPRPKPGDATQPDPLETAILEGLNDD